MRQQHSSVQKVLTFVWTRLYSFIRNCERATNEVFGFYYVLHSFGWSSERALNGVLEIYFVLHPFGRFSERQQKSKQSFNPE
jgi:hypothetical protein